MMMMIKSTSFQMTMDHHLMMTWTCQEFRTRGKHMTQVHHQLRFLILMFQSKKFLILDKMTILHQDLTQLLNQSEFKGNRDRSQLLLLMRYQRQRPRWLSRGQRFNYQVMSNLFQFLLRHMMMKEMKDLHMILMPQVQMIAQFHRRLLLQHRLCQWSCAASATAVVTRNTRIGIISKRWRSNRTIWNRRYSCFDWGRDCSASGRRCGHWTLHIKPLWFCRHWWYCFCSFRTQNPSCSWFWFIWCYWLQSIWTVSCQEWKEAAKGRISYHPTSLEEVC